MTEQRPITAAMPMSSPGDYYDLSRIRPEVLAMLDKVNALGPRFAERARAVDDEASSRWRITAIWRRKGS